MADDNAPGPPEGGIQIVLPANLGRIEVRGQGDEPLVKEACEWIVEHGKSATNEGSLSEGAYLEMCNLTRAKYVGVCPTRHRKTLEVLGETIVRMGETARSLSDLKDQHIDLQKRHRDTLSEHRELLVKYGNLQDVHLEVLEKNKQHLIRETNLLNKNAEHLTRETKAIKADTARMRLLAECMKELQRLDAWTDELQELDDRDTEAQDKLQKLKDRDAEKVEPADQSDAAQPRRSKRKRGEAGASAEA